MTNFICLHNAEDKLRKRKDKQGKLVTDQVEQPNWLHMAKFRDFLLVFVQLIDRLECHQALLYEQYISAKVIEELDSGQFSMTGFPDVTNLVESVKNGYEKKFLDGCINTTAIFSFAMIPSKTIAQLLKSDVELKNNVTAYRVVFLKCRIQG